jgi:hypothetical protein
MAAPRSFSMRQIPKAQPEEEHSEDHGDELQGMRAPGLSYAVVRNWRNVYAHQEGQEAQVRFREPEHSCWKRTFRFRKAQKYRRTVWVAPRLNRCWHCSILRSRGSTSFEFRGSTTDRPSLHGCTRKNHNNTFTWCGPCPQPHMSHVRSPGRPNNRTSGVNSMSARCRGEIGPYRERRADTSQRWNLDGRRAVKTINWQRDS